MNLFKHPISLTLTYLALRIVLSPFSPVPGAVALDPLWIFAVLLQLKGGKVWVASLLPVLIFGDWMADFTWAQILMRSVGFMALASLPIKGDFNRLSFFWISQHALWSALMPDWQGFYPLGYVYAIGFLQGVFWWGILAPIKGGGTSKPLGAFLIVPLGIGFLNLILPSPGIWPLPQLGDHGGLVLQVVSGLLLPVPFIVHFLSKPRPERNPLPGRRPGRWTHLAE
jgi:hypothetical protein